MSRKHVLAAGVVSAILAGSAVSASAAPILLAGFDDATNVARQDSSVASGGIVASMTGQNAGGTGNGSGLWGTASYTPAPSTTNGRVRANSNYTLTISITNQTGYDVLLDALHIDYNRATSNSAKTLTMTYVSGDLSVTGGTTIATVALSGTGYKGVDNSLSSLSDYTLGNGESATFSLAFTGNTSSDWIYTDNLAISGTVLSVPTPAAFSAGLGLLALGAIRRRG